MRIDHPRPAEVPAMPQCNPHPARGATSRDGDMRHQGVPDNWRLRWAPRCLPAIAAILVLAGCTHRVYRPMSAWPAKHDAQDEVRIRLGDERWHRARPAPGARFELLDRPGETVELAQVTHLVHVRPPTGGGALIGLVAGATAGVVLGFAVAAGQTDGSEPPDDRQTCPLFGDTPPPDDCQSIAVDVDLDLDGALPLIGGVSLGLVGLAIGTLVGSSPTTVTYVAEAPAGDDGPRISVSPHPYGGAIHLGWRF